VILTSYENLLYASLKIWEMLFVKLSIFLCVVSESELMRATLETMNELYIIASNFYGSFDYVDVSSLYLSKCK